MHLHVISNPFSYEHHAKHSNSANSLTFKNVNTPPESTTKISKNLSTSLFFTNITFCNFLIENNSI